MNQSMIRKMRKTKRKWHHVSEEELATATAFERVFEFDYDSSWQLPSVRETFVGGSYCLEKLLALKKRLNDTKALLNDIDIEVWHEHTRRTHVTGRVAALLREQCGAELCTQAWVKFYEILHSFFDDLDLGGQLTSVHLCEAPGAFVTSLNHYIKTTRPSLQWNWIASTLNPYYEGNSRDSMIDDDGFISHTLEHWNFGEDDSGNLLSMKNISSLIAQARRLGHVRLVTADGSIDCQQQPGEQEQLVAGLHFGEVVAAVTLLDVGGAFVLKMFTLFEHSAVCLVYLLVCAFNKVSVVKPSASKAGNSEVYLVCRGFNKLPEPFLRKLHHHVGCRSMDSLNLFPMSALPPSFLSQLEQCQQFFVDLQICAIDTNVSHFGSPRAVTPSNKVRRKVAWDFLERFSVQPLPPDLRLMVDTVKDGRHVFVSTPHEWHEGVRRRLSGSYSERMQCQQLGWSQRLLKTITSTALSSSLVDSYLLKFIGSENGKEKPFFDQSLKGTNETLSANCLQFVRGQLPHSVCSSRFCHPFYLEQLADALAGAEVISRCPRFGCQCGNHDNKSSTWLVEKRFREVFNSGKVLTGCCVDLMGLSEVSVYAQQQSPLLQCVSVQWPYSFATMVTDETHLVVSCPRLPNAHHALLWLCETLPTKLPTDYVDIVIGGYEVTTACRLSVAVGVEELSGRAALLASCISACKVLSPGGMFCCYLDSCLTRWTVCLLFVLHHCFEKINLLHLNTGCVSGGQQLLVCNGFKAAHPDLLLKLCDLHKEVVLFPFENTCLSFVPMTRLYDQDFFVYLREYNDAMLERRLEAIVKAEQRWLLHQDGKEMATL